MTIQRYDMIGMYGSEVYVDEREQGKWVKYEDYLKIVESLEYEIRYLEEKLEITGDERNYYKDKYNELYEQTT